MKNKNNSFSNFFSKLEILVFILLLYLDQLIKAMVNNVVDLGGSVFQNNIFEITKLYNYGVSFGFLQGKNILILIATAVSLYILYQIKKDYNSKSINFGVILIFSGAIGNLVDRIFRGYVIDYIKLNFIEFPIFNLADILIFSGVGIIIIFEYYKYFKEKKGKTHE